MIDKNYKHKIIDLGGLDVNEITDDAYILEIYNALKNNFGYPVEIKNFKINGNIHLNVINTPCIETDFITVNLGDYYLTVTQDNIEAQKGTYITGSLGVENDLDINGDFYANSANITNNTNTDNLSVTNTAVIQKLSLATVMVYSPEGQTYELDPPDASSLYIVCPHGDNPTIWNASFVVYRNRHGAIEIKELAMTNFSVSYDSTSNKIILTNTHATYRLQYIFIKVL